MVIYTYDYYKNNKDLNIIKECALKELSIYYDKKYKYIGFDTFHPFKAYNKTVQQLKYTPKVELVEYLNNNIYQRNKFKFKTNFEKDFFACNFLFPDDNNFLKMLNDKNNLEFLTFFINKLSVIDNIQDTNKKAIVTSIYYKNYKAKYNYEFASLQQYFNTFYRINSIELIINRLLQIYYLNNELYRQYTTEESKKKLKQI